MLSAHGHQGVLYETILARLFLRHIGLCGGRHCRSDRFDIAKVAQDTLRAAIERVTDALI